MSGFGMNCGENRKTPGDVVLPGPGMVNSARFHVDDDELDLFNTKLSLKNLIEQKRVVIIDNDVWFYIGDKKAIDILNYYFARVEAVKNSGDECSK